MIQGNVESIAVFEGDLYIGGNFTIKPGGPAVAIARWDGANWVEVNPVPTSTKG